MITQTDIIEGARFRTISGVVWIIDRIKSTDEYGLLVYSYMETGKNGNYCDSIVDAVNFLNEEQAVLINQ